MKFYLTIKKNKIVSLDLNRWNWTALLSKISKTQKIKGCTFLSPRRGKWGEKEKYWGMTLAKDNVTLCACITR